MSRKQPPGVAEAVALLRWQIDRHDNIRADERKPTTCDRFWRGGYTAAMRTVLDAANEALRRAAVEVDDDHAACRIDVLSRVLQDVVEIAAAGIESDYAEDYADRWARS